MCTSFAAYSSKTYFGMNFDFPEVELRFELAKEPAGEVFYLSFGWDGRFPRVMGFNPGGLFASAQILVASFDVSIRSEEDLVSPYEFFTQSLAQARTVDQVLMLLGSRRLGYSSQRKGHQLFADVTGEACVIEPGPQGNRIFRSDGPVMVMANRPLENELRRESWKGEPKSHDRYGVARRMIEERLKDFSIQNGFEILSRVAIQKGRFQTQCSLVCDPQAGECYFAIRREYSRIWKANLRERWVETNTGFAQHQKRALDAGGILASSLDGPVKAL